MNHRGFSLINVFQPCVTFNPANSYDFYRARVYKLTDQNHNPSDLNAAWAKSQELEEKIPLGVIYDIERPTYTDSLPQLQNGPLINNKMDLELDKFISDFI